MFSFYSLPSSILKHEKYTKLHAAYAYYYFSTKTPVRQLLTDALVLAKQCAAYHLPHPSFNCTVIVTRQCAGHSPPLSYTLPLYRHPRRTVRGSPPPYPQCSLTD